MDRILVIMERAAANERLESLATLLGHEIRGAEESWEILMASDPEKVRLAASLLDSYMQGYRMAGAVKDLGMDPVMGALISLRLAGASL